MSLLTGGTVVQGDFITSSAGSGDSGKAPKLNASGELDASFVHTGYGDGSDGVAALDGSTTVAWAALSGGNTYTMSRSCYCTNITLSASITLITNGWLIYATGTITGPSSAIITWGTANNGTAGGSTASVTTPGTAGAGGTQTTSQNSQTTGPLGNKAGGAGGIGGDGNANPGNAGSAASGVVINPCLGVDGIVGGTGGRANGGGSVGSSAIAHATAPYTKFGIHGFLTLAMIDLNASAAFAYFSGSVPGSGGGGGGANHSNGSPDSGGGGGGGGGASSGTVFICARTWAGQFVIKGLGGNGAAGGNSTSTNIAGAGGGGSGGNGACTVVVYGVKTWTGTYTITGGTAGAAGTGSSFTAAGVGNAGATGTSYEIAISNLTK